MRHCVLHSLGIESAVINASGDVLFGEPPPGKRLAGSRQWIGPERLTEITRTSGPILRLRPVGTHTSTLN